MVFLEFTANKRAKPHAPTSQIYNCQGNFQLRHDGVTIYLQIIQTYKVHKTSTIVILFSFHNINHRDKTSKRNILKQTFQLY